MQDDDLMPLNGGAFHYATEPIEQVNERKKEKAEIAQAKQTLLRVIERLEERIKFYESVDAMPEDCKKDPVKFMNMHNANQLTRDNLRAEKEFIEQMID